MALYGMPGHRILSAMCYSISYHQHQPLLQVVGRVLFGDEFEQPELTISRCAEHYRSVGVLSIPECLLVTDSEAQALPLVITAPHDAVCSKSSSELHACMRVSRHMQWQSGVGGHIRS